MGRNLSGAVSMVPRGHTEDDDEGGHTGLS